MSTPEIAPTFAIISDGERASIKCLLCYRVSFGRRDVENRYCGACHLFHDAVIEGRARLSEPTAHDCGEWKTALDACALCGRVLA